MASFAADRHHDNSLCVHACVNALCSTPQVWLFEQRAGQNAMQLVAWDYHVLALQRRGPDTLVWDLDT